MTLEEEIKLASKKVVKDGYDMSVGELFSLYRDKELVVNPNFQRYFRWDISHKTRFIESLLLGIPIPPIFVFTTEGRKWELVDGLQRLSTLFEFAGILRNPDGGLYAPSVLDGTTLLPSLADKRWQPSSDDGEDGLTEGQQIDIKRVRIRVEILKKESDPHAKYELFQRLNTGGATLSEQEIRNCTMIMISPTFYEWLSQLAAYPPFVACVDQTDRAEKRQRLMELALRLVVYRYRPYGGRLDVHEYLDEATISLASDQDFAAQHEATVFRKTFDILNEALGENAFKKWDGSRFLGQSTLSAYEVAAFGLSTALDKIESMDAPQKVQFVREKIKELWANPDFLKNSGAGVRGTTRLFNLVPLARTIFAS